MRPERVRDPCPVWGPCGTGFPRPAICQLGRSRAVRIDHEDVAVSLEDDHASRGSRGSADRSAEEGAGREGDPNGSHGEGHCGSPQAAPWKLGWRLAWRPCSDVGAEIRDGHPVESPETLT